MMPNKSITISHPDTKDATIEINCEKGDNHCNIFSVSYDNEGGRYQCDTDLNKKQLKEYIDILTEAYKIIS